MRNENERGQMILQKASNACRRIQVFMVCLVGVLIFLELLNVKIDFGCSHSIRLAIFIIITGLFKAIPILQLRNMGIFVSMTYSGSNCISLPNFFFSKQDEMMKDE